MRAKTENRDCYLYDGTGNPWAGHSNVIAPPRIILNACESANDGNFGRVLATGSKGDTKKNMTEDTSIRTGRMIASFIALFFIWIISLISSRASIRVRVQPTDALEIPKFLYLKAGTGNAWAGHIKVSGWSQWTVYVREFSVIGNFGFVLATGSTRKHLRYRRDRWVDSLRCVERRDRAITPELLRRSWSLFLYIKRHLRR